MYRNIDSPFGSVNFPDQSRNCYDEVFDRKKYEYKSTIDLVGWVKNLLRKIEALNESDPHPTELIQKLEERVSGITSMIQSRREAAGTEDSTLERIAVRKRLRESEAILASLNSSTSSKELDHGQESQPDVPMSKRLKILSSSTSGAIEEMRVLKRTLTRTEPGTPKSNSTL